MTDRLTAIRRTLDDHGQAHVLAFYDQLSASQQNALLDQLQAIDFNALDAWVRDYVKTAPEAKLPPKLEPAPYYRRPDDPEHAAQYDAAHYRGIGEDLLRSGKVAAFTVAGGQGTRLGWNGPKGTYPATPVTGKPLFRVFAEQIHAAQVKYGVTIPWYIMTSPINDAATRAFITDNNCFGLTRKNIFMFPQGVMPTLDAETGKLLLAEKHEIAVHPDGHGGAIKALRTSGAIEDMSARGIEHISYFQIDNPLARAVDPLFLGLHTAAPDSSADLSSKMVAKAYPEEKVGVFCKVDGKVAVVEYSDLPQELNDSRDESGKLRFNAGSIAIHLFGVKFVERLTADADRFALPFHRAVKKAAYIDPATGERIEPEEPNAVKLETFVFDALPLAENSIVLETTREEFAPIKNASGVDSPTTSHELQTERNARWLEQLGVKVPRTGEGKVNATIEISPLTALEPEDFPATELPQAIASGSRISL